MDKKTKIKMLFSSSKTWYAFTIKNNLKKSISRVVEYPNASVEYIKYFLLFQDGRVETKIQKQNKLLVNRNHGLRRINFDVNLLPGEIVQVFMQIESYHLKGVDLDIRSIENALDFESKYSVLSILYIGLSGALLLYYIFISLLHKSLISLSFNAFVITLVAIIVIVADMPVYFGIVVPSWIHRLIPPMRPLIGVTGLYFLQVFLETQKRVPRMNILIQILKYTLVIFFLLGCSSYYAISSGYVKDLNLIYLIVSITVSLYIYLKDKYTPSLYFLSAFTILLISGIIHLLTWHVGLFDRTFILSNIIVFGSSAQMLLFSFAISAQQKNEVSAELQLRLEAQNELEKLNEELSDPPVSGKLEPEN